jgi:hypothetical protein
VVTWAAMDSAVPQPSSVNAGPPVIVHALVLAVVRAFGLSGVGLAALAPVLLGETGTPFDGSPRASPHLRRHWRRRGAGQRVALPRLLAAGAGREARPVRRHRADRARLRPLAPEPLTGVARRQAARRPGARGATAPHPSAGGAGPGAFSSLGDAGFGVRLAALALVVGCGAARAPVAPRPEVVPPTVELRVWRVERWCGGARPPPIEMRRAPLVGERLSVLAWRDGGHQLDAKPVATIRTDAAGRVEVNLAAGPYCFVGAEAGCTHVQIPPEARQVDVDVTSREECGWEKACRTSPATCRRLP